MAIQVAFQELEVFETSNTRIPLSDTEPLPFARVQVVENVERTTDMQLVASIPRGVLSPSMQDVASDLERALAPEIRNHVVEISPTNEGLVVRLREVGFYESGDAALLPFLFTFDNCDVSIHRKIGEALCAATGLRPFHLERINRASFAQP
jgi:flagellar motor protein MotB